MHQNRFRKADRLPGQPLHPGSSRERFAFDLVRVLFADCVMVWCEVTTIHSGQVQAERGFRFLKDPSFLASSLYLKKPERIMALFMVMTVCLLVYAALEYRIRQALSVHEATFPDQKGKRIRNPTARWVLQYFVGIHLLCQAGQWPIVLNLTEEHQHLLHLLGRPYMRFYDVRYS